MKTSLENIKIVMSYEDGQQLHDQLLAMLKELSKMSESLSDYFDEAHLRETYPKVNEFLQVLNVREEMPF